VVGPLGGDRGLDGRLHHPVRQRTIALNHATERLAELLMASALKEALRSKRVAEILESP